MQQLGWISKVFIQVKEAHVKRFLSKKKKMKKLGLPWWSSG